MARAFGRGPGGIQALLTLPREEWEALEADLLSFGFTLADVPVRVSWRALVAYVTRAGHGSMLHGERSDEDTPWPRVEQLLGLIHDAITQLHHVTIRSNGGEPAREWQPLPRPGVVAALPEGTKHVGSDPIPAAHFDHWWNTGEELD